MRPMFFACTICAAAGVVSTRAPARPVVGLDLQLSYDTLQWREHLAYSPGSTIYVRVVMTIPDTFYGISGAKYNITSLPGQWDVGGIKDEIDLSVAKGKATDGRVPGFDFGGQTQTVFEDGGSFRIDQKGDTTDHPSAGINTAQATPGSLGTSFNTAKSAEVYRFAVKVNPETMVANGGLLQIRISDGSNGPVNQITVFKVYETINSTSGIQLDGARGDIADIYIPPPATCAVVGCGALAFDRRRRRRARHGIPPPRSTHESPM
jgi:hypothetical protein